MRTAPAFRVGRRVYHDDSGRSRTADRCIAALVLAVFLVLVPLGLYRAEAAYRNAVEAFGEIEREVISLPDSEDGDIVHFQSDEVDASSADVAFGVALQGVVQISRETEYCQWSESSTTKRDENNRTYTQYYYTKMWRSYRVNSMMFDQAAAHHNPQRDPLPSATFAASGARLGVGEGRVATVDQAILEHTKAPWRRVDWTLGAVPRPARWLFWRSRDSTRYESIEALAGAESSPAARAHNFAYVGQGGYFFSPYQASMSESLFKYFVQYLEGSLLDWQLGDLMPSCTAGDIRVRFRVQDPHEVSVVGKVKHDTKNKACRIGLYRTPKGHDVGMLHAGYQSFQDMISEEIKQHRLWCMAMRAVTLLLASALGWAAGERWRVDWRMTSLGVWGFCVGGVWLGLWGAERFSLAALPLAGACLAAARWLPGRQAAKESKEEAKRE